MTSFAFPCADILPDKRFMGCGRYAAMKTAMSDGWRRPSSTIINRARVEQAAALWTLSRETGDRTVYERKDQPQRKYAGESMHLAYLLALIQCSRRLRHNWDTDIWCTGVVEMPDERHPTLHEVAHEQFEIKLDAFLSANNPDKLFIAPEADVLRATALINFALSRGESVMKFCNC